MGPSPIPRCRSPNVVPVETRRRRRLWKGGQPATDQRDRHGEPRLQSVSNPSIVVYGLRLQYIRAAKKGPKAFIVRKRLRHSALLCSSPLQDAARAHLRPICAAYASAIKLQTLAMIRVAHSLKSRLFRSPCEGADGGSEMPNHRRLTRPGMRCVVTQL